MQKKEYDLALIHFNKSLRHDKNDYHARNNIGHILLIKGHIEQSIKEFKASLRISSHFPSALRGLGIAYKQKNDYERAYGYFSNSLDKNRKCIITRLHIIETLLLMKNEPLLKKILSETFSVIPFHKMKSVIMDLKQNNFPYEMSPDLNIIIPVLARIYPEFDI